MIPIRYGGFTLIELMIAVTIIGIVGTIAIPSYRASIIKGNRTDGRAALLEQATVLEKCKAIYGVYNRNCSFDSSSSIISNEALYSLGLEVLTESTFTLKASPVSGKTQENDSECTGITLNHLGEKSGTGAAPEECW